MAATKITNLVGPKGSTGDQGPVGNTGATGPQGNPGAPGVQGPDGTATISTDATNTAVLGSDSKLFVPATTTPPLADSTQNGLVRQLNNSTASFIDGTNHTQDLGTAERPIIWSARQRSFNSLDNSNFEIDQRFAGTAASLGAGTGYIMTVDRWRIARSLTGTSTIAWGQSAIGSLGLPFNQSTYALRVYPTTAQATLAAGDYLALVQGVAGIRMRQMLGGPTSLTFGVQNSCPSAINIAVSLQNVSGTTQCWVGPLVTINPGYTAITIPNIPAFPAAGTWPFSGQAYVVRFCLGCGSTYICPSGSVGVWQGTQYMAPAGITNFMASTSNSIYFYYAQHEPLPYCSPYMDEPYEQNLRRCQRFFCKSGPERSKPPAGFHGLGLYVTTGVCRLSLPFPVTMDANPAMTFWDNTGIPNQVYQDALGAVAIKSIDAVSANRAWQITLNTTGAYQNYPTSGYWQADVGY